MFALTLFQWTYRPPISPLNAPDMGALLVLDGAGAPALAPVFCCSLATILLSSANTSLSNPCFFLETDCPAVLAYAG
jgi:hypothetical protein